MKLYDVPPRTFIRFEGVRYFFEHVDGMYSYCLDESGNVVHLIAWAEVNIDE